MPGLATHFALGFFAQALRPLFFRPSLLGGLPLF